MGARALRVGLVGLGAIGHQHARVLSQLDGVQLVGIVDPAGDPTGEWTPLLTELPALLAGGLDYAVIASPAETHTTIGLTFAEHGVPALIEKPLGGSVATATALVEGFEAAGVLAGAAHIERYNPALRGLRSRLDAGELGRIFQVVTSRQGPLPARMGTLGVVMDLATHDVDLVRWVTGQEYATVAARAMVAPGYQHEGLVTITGELTDGTLVSQLVNWMSPFKERRTVVTGERGCFVADTVLADLTFYANGAIDTEWDALRTFRGVAEGDAIRYALVKREPLVLAHEHFRDAVDGKDSDIVPLRQALRAIEICDAVLRSSATGTTVDCRPTQRTR